MVCRLPEAESSALLPACEGDFYSVPTAPHTTAKTATQAVSAVKVERQRQEAVPSTSQQHDVAPKQPTMQQQEPTMQQQQDEGEQVAGQQDEGVEELIQRMCVCLPH